MKRSRKTLFALLLALVMTLGLAATAWATEGDNGTMVLPDDFVVNQPTPEAPEAYKIPFTKVVEQKGAFAPGPMRFSLEAFLPNENGGADTPLHTFSFDTSGTGIGSFSSEMTIPANVLGNREGFYVREVNGGASGWTYSTAEWYVNFDPREDQDGKPLPTIHPYDVQGAPVDKMTFENIYTRNISHTTPDVKPTSSPKTFDAGVALYGVSTLLSLTGTALVIKRKNG